MSQDTFPFIGKYRFGWTAALVLVTMFVFGLVTGLTEAIWRLSPEWLLPFGLLATVVGWCIAGRKPKPFLNFSAGILIGLILLISFQSGVFQNFYQAYLETFRIQIHFSYPQFYLPNMGPLFYYLYTALNNLSNYWVDITQWAHQIIFYQGGFNQLAINLVWGSMVWAVSLTLGWLLRRKSHPFTASLPALILLSVVIGFSRQRSSGLIIALTALLTIMVLIEHLKRESRWENQQIDYSEELRFEIISITVPIVAIIMIIAIVIPRVSLENIRTLLFDQQRRVEIDTRVDIPESLGLEQVPHEPLITTSQPGMPRSHLIGSGVELAETLIMQIDTGETYLPPQVETREQPPRYYWFGRSYDKYIGSGWITEELRMETIPANEELLSEIPPYFRPVFHRVTKTDAATPILYFAGVLNTVDQRITAAWHETTGEYFAAQLIALEYQVNSFVYDFTEDQLRQSDEIPPDLILETYLQLPPELPERVIELALNITTQSTTPYTKAIAIESYLRQYEYSLDLPTPPQARDLVDYFLFDLQKGYCDYYASAMVILARINRLPARLAVGYATGTYDYTQQAFIVTEANAHAWPEVYIAPMGWVPFEPTASLSTHPWITEDEIHPSEVPPIPSVEHITGPESPWLEFLGVGILLLLILLAGYLWFTIFHHKDKQSSTTSQIEVVYQNMRGQLTQTFFALQTEHTPREFCQVYTQHLNQMSSQGLIQRLCDQINDYIISTTFLYEKGMYSPQLLPAEHVREARQHLFSTLLRVWLLKAVLLFKNS